MTGRSTKFGPLVEAAEGLGMSKRQLLDWLRANPLDQHGQPYCIGACFIRSRGETGLSVGV